MELFLHQGVVNSIKKPIKSYHDNEATTRFSKNKKISSAFSHNEVKFLIVKERAKNGLVSIEQVRIAAMLAYLHTKAIKPDTYSGNVFTIGLTSSLKFSEISHP